MQGYLFFKKVERRVFLRELVHCMQRSYLKVKDTKQVMLKKYIYFCATKIQSLGRSYLARKISKPIRQKLGKRRLRLLGALTLGW